MGQFSWIYSDTKKQLLDNKYADTYLLVPEPFQEKYGKAIHETYYGGYGHFGSYDVYELVAEWNREYLSKDMLREAPQLENFGGLWQYEIDELKENGLSEEEIKQKDLEAMEHHYKIALAWYEKDLQRLLDYKNGFTDEEMFQKYEKYWKREIGIDIACGDERNKRIPYPIKITSKITDYDEVEPSLEDPNQGWEQDDEEDDWI